MPYFLIALHDLIMDSFEVIISHFNKRRETLVTFTLETIKRQHCEFYAKVNEAMDKLTEENEKLKNQEHRVLESDAYRTLKLRFDEVYPRILQLNIQSISPEELDEMKRNNLINAIRLHRMRTGFGLKESKDTLELYMQEHKLGRWAGPDDTKLEYFKPS